MPLVLLGGMGCSPRLWAGVRDRLGPGPVLDATPDRPTIDGCVDALLDALPPRFALSGLSLGGIVAMALVRRAPERVVRLALLSTNARPPLPAQRAAWAAQRAALAGGATARDLQAELLPVLLHDPSCAGPALAMADDVGAQVLDHQLAAQATRVDERPALARVAVPTLVLAARQDRLCPLDRHEEIAALVPGARLEVLDGVGHLSPLEAPDRVASALERWWAGEPGVRPAAPGTPASSRG
ncbi:alpha/beta fold hydrolase [Pseudonocardia broussonetiae]|uniref:Alpha/beta fold hydrolase n=1 Tax=Pseudonocardia broussonetiae TaxID=2736640 RepID=A0A6M6JPF9_9PSEU|nr:alpha/beta fold hydrolase [Pseudonocardia broussonetiae]QJY48191.1 alpha/beta fold hydrolase [Pseudonocardia broussonetiae]